MDITLSFPQRILALGLRSGALLLYGDIYHHYKSGLQYDRLNREIAIQFGVSERTICTWLSELETAQLIFREVEYGRGVRRIIYHNES